MEYIILFALYVISNDAIYANVKKADIRINQLDRIEDVTNQISYHNKANFVNPTQIYDLVKIDSSFNQYSMFTQIQECLAYNPSIMRLEFVSRGYTQSGVLNVAQTDAFGSYWISDQGVYNQEFNPARFPTAVASGNISGNGPHISFPGLLSYWGFMLAQYESGGWYSGLWDMPADIGQGDVNTSRVIGKQLPNNNILFLGLTADTSFMHFTGIIYRTTSTDLQTIFTTDTLTSRNNYWGFDINGGIAYVFYYDDSLNIYYKTTTDGIAWSAEQPYNLIWPNPYTNNIIYWTQMALTDNGNPILVFDNIDGDDTTYPYYGKIYVSTGSGQPCIEVSSGFGAPDTECFYPTIATGGDMVVVLFHVPRNNLSDSLCFWDIFYNASTDNGNTWNYPINETYSTNFNHCLGQLAKRLQPSYPGGFFYAFGSAKTNPSLDILWGAMDNYINAPTYWYINIPESAVDENVSNLHNASKLNIYPNPFNRTAHISYSVVRDPQSARLGIYNTTGQLVVDLSSRLAVCGSPAALSWSGSDQNGRPLPNGVYFVKLVSGDQQIVQKLILLQ